MAPGYGTTEHNQIMWTRYCAPVRVFARAGLNPGESDVRTRFASNQGERAPRLMRVIVLPTLPPVSAPAWSHIGLWEGWRASSQADSRAVSDYFRTLRETGFGEVHISSPAR